MFARGFLILVSVLLLGCRPSVTGAPEKKMTYGVERVLNSVTFNQPVQVVFLPGETQRIFVVEHGGAIVMVRDPSQPKREIFFDLSSIGPTFDREHGVLAMSFHPRFAENGFFYVWFSVRAGNQRSNRLARFKVSDRNAFVGDAATQLPMISQPTGPSGHDGGEIVFGPDGYLYLSLGDGDEHLSEPTQTRQRIDRSFFGGIIRIDVDQKPGSLPPTAHASVHAGSYTVPPDNPFVGATSFNGLRVDPTKVRTEFWAVGLRNPWRMAFDSETGRLWCGDVGLKLREEIDVIVRGGNYGWNYREGIKAGPRASAPAGAKFIEPIWDYDRSQGISVTGGLVYRGKKYPDLVGKYLFADFGMNRLWALDPDGEKPVDDSHVVQIASAETLVALTVNPANDDVWLTSFGGKIFRLVEGSAKK